MTSHANDTGPESLAHATELASAELVTFAAAQASRYEVASHDEL